MGTKPKSRITVSNRRDGVTTIRATGGYAMAMLAALCGKTPEEMAKELKGSNAETTPAPENKETPSA